MNCDQGLGYDCPGEIDNGDGSTSWNAYLSCSGSKGQYIQGASSGCRKCKCPAGYSFHPENPEFSADAIACTRAGGKWLSPTGQDTVSCADAYGKATPCKDIFGRTITVYSGCRRCDLRVPPPPASKPAVRRSPWFVARPGLFGKVGSARQQPYLMAMTEDASQPAEAPAQASVVGGIGGAGLAAIALLGGWLLLSRK